MATSPSKYAENQFLFGIFNSLSLMNELLDDTIPRAANAVGGNGAFTGVMSSLEMIATVWKGAWISLLVQEAALPGKTLAFNDKVVSLTRKPDADTSSLLGT